MITQLDSSVRLWRDSETAIVTRYLRLLLFVLVVSGCASMTPTVDCSAGQSGSACIPGDAVVDEKVTRSYQSRTWVKPEDRKVDPIRLGMEAEIPIQGAYAKLIGPSQEDSLRSLALKIWLIDHAEHTIDASYYIFKRDLVGQAILAAMCNAVKRGVDVRLLVDSIGSLHPTHRYLKSLVNCTDDAGFMRNEKGQLTNRRARAQVVVINALSNIVVNANRRSHDKILVIDGHYPDRGYVLTGGRNISLDYYGIKEDGTPDPDAFKDLEILLKAGADKDEVKFSVGSGAEVYVTVLSLNPGNKLLNPWFSYQSQAQRLQQSLATLRGFDEFKRLYDEMDSFMNAGFIESDVRLAHELGNFQSTNVVEGYAENLDANPNSIVGILNSIGREVDSIKTIRIVSPYLFMPEYTTASGDVLHDGKDALDTWLEQDPERRVEIITNSVLTSDNALAQSMIDIDMAPRMLLSDELSAFWKSDVWEGETNPQLVESEEWKEQVANPRIKIYQLGKLDSDYLGGDKSYGKLHAKFVLTDAVGFVGTTNLDYRSRLYNNEMGYFFDSQELREELKEIFEDLKKDSYLWGTPEWLEMRDQVRRSGGLKGRGAYRQRKTYRGLQNFGLKWQI